MGLDQRLNIHDTQIVALFAYCVKLGAGCDLETAAHAMGQIANVIADGSGVYDFEVALLSIESASELAVEMISGKKGCESCKAMGVSEYLHRH